MKDESKPQVNPIVLGLIILVVVAVLGVPVVCSSDSALTDAFFCPNEEQDGGYTLLEPLEFRDFISSRDVFLVDAYPGEHRQIPGTDAKIPPHLLEAKKSVLPVERDAVIGVYCRKDPKSNEVAEMLSEMGYVNVVKLSGGTDAWKQQGLYQE